MKAMPAGETTPDFDSFTRWAASHTLVPVTRTVVADLETPVGAFLRVATGEPEAFLLESVDGIPSSAAGPTAPSPAATAKSS